MRTELFNYDLPEELIAQAPLTRGESRLLVLHKTDGRIEHRQFADLPDYLHAGDMLVLNDTRVTARRLEAVRMSGKAAEVFLLRPVGDKGWEALIRPGKALKPGREIELIGPAPDCQRLIARVVATTPEGGRVLELPDAETRDWLTSWGSIPLPPYIHSPLPGGQEERYQTVYACNPGSAAAPTAGLHFTQELLARIDAMGVERVTLTLNVGVDTFRPVRAEEIEAHEMHGEHVVVPAAAARRINACSGRIIAVGTTSVRALESAAALAEASPNAATPDAMCRVAPFAGETHLFITPGYRFHAVDALITNFHLPRSTLLMLVSAFAGRDAVLRAYAEAVRERYRFYSFGDAMLII